MHSSKSHVLIKACGGSHDVVWHTGERRKKYRALSHLSIESED